MSIGRSKPLYYGHLDLVGNGPEMTTYYGSKWLHLLWGLVAQGRGLPLGFPVPKRYHEV